MKTIKFFYGLGSRYSYLAVSQIDKIQRQANAKIDWLPLYSARLFVDAKHNPFMADNLRGQYDPDYRVKDTKRWSDYYSIPFTEPDSEGVDWSLHVKACLIAKERNLIKEYTSLLFDQTFGRGRPSKTTAELVVLAVRLGMDASSFEEDLLSDAIKDEEARIVEDAINAGVFGVPSFLVGTELFWGQDRIPLVIHHLQS